MTGPRFIGADQSENVGSAVMEHTRTVRKTPVIGTNRVKAIATPLRKFSERSVY